MAKRAQTGWAVTIGGTMAVIVIVAASAIGFWQYASYAPPFRPPLALMPSPNGYAIASQAVARLARTRRPPRPRAWPDGSPAELRAQLAVVRPILEQVRAAFRLEWRVPVLGADEGDRMPRFGECARCFAADSLLKRDEGDYTAAMQSSLDTMELGAKLPRGDRLFARMTGLVCHAMGFDAAERTVSQLPASAIPAALARVRRLRREWPSLAETLENERVMKRSMDAETFGGMARQPIGEQVRMLRGAGLSFDEAVRVLLTPRRTILANGDRFFEGQVAESKKPVRQRVPVLPSDDPWSAHMLDRITPASLAGWEREETDLALLEVGLAVQMDYLEHGRYPGQLSDIAKKWLPAIPTDLWDQPIAYRLKDGQPIIYSLGPDGKDDGGQPADPIGLTPNYHLHPPCSRARGVRW